MDTYRQRKYNFSAISIKAKVAGRFRKFSKGITRSHTDTLETMMDFFQSNQLSPLENFGPTVRGMEVNIKRRINSMIGIIKDIEKHQTKPTMAMLELLFEHSPQKKSKQEPLLLDGQKDNLERDMFFKKMEQAIAIEKEHTNLQRELSQTREEYVVLLDKINLVKNSFGKPRLQLDMDPKDFEKLKVKVKKR